jgi:[ribosomal protein S5]-alanine N-acetyltransferase
MQPGAMTIPTFQTRSLTLRPLALTDAPPLFEILQEPGILQYFPPAPPPSLERTERYILRQSAHWEKHGYGHWGVVTPEDERLVGWVGLEFLPELGETEVAYLVSGRVRGRGYASEAGQAALSYGLGNCRLEYIIGLVHPENAASIRVLEKCGLAYVDRLTLWGLELARYSTRRGHEVTPITNTIP